MINYDSVYAKVREFMRKVISLVKPAQQNAQRCL